MEGSNEGRGMNDGLTEGGAVTGDAMSVGELEVPSELELTELYRQRLQREEQERRLVGNMAIRILIEAEEQGLKIGGLSTATADRLRKEGIRLPFDVIDDALLRLDNGRIILWNSEGGHYSLNRSAVSVDQPNEDIA